MRTSSTRLGLALLAVSAPLFAQIPAIAPNGVLNAADYTRDIAPGAMVAVFGTNLAPRTTAASSVPLPRSLEGVAVEVMPPAGAWTAVPLYFVSPAQINIQLPFLTASTLQIRVRTAAGTGAPATLSLSPRAPRIFTRSMDGKGEPTLFHSRDFSWVSAAAPAVPGEYLVLLLTGLGAVSPAKDAGAPGGDNGANGPLNAVTEPVTVSFGGLSSPAAFAGLMPGFPGVYQVNFQVPDGIPAGAQTLQVRTGTVASQLNVAASCARFAPGAITATLTPAGGTLSAPGATVQVAPGVFSEPSTLALAPLPAAATPVDSWRASPVFQLSGLPATLNAPVTLTFDLSSRQPAGETLVALASGPGVRGAGLEFLEATVSGSQATVTLPANPGPDTPKSLAAPRTASGPEVSLYVMTFFQREAAGDFLLFYPSSQLQSADVAAVAAVLQQTKSQLTSLGLNWDRRTRWPLRVVIYPFTGADADKWGMAEPSILGLNYHSISLNANKLAAGVSTEFKATAGHELFHILQNLYDPRDALRIAKSPGPWLWFQEAASTWFEPIATGDPSTVPSTVRQNNYSFLTQHGLEFQPGDPAAVQSHGYGAALFLHFLSGRAGGNAVVGSILKEGLQRAPGILADSARWPVEGAASVLSGMLAEHWRNFVTAYTEGNLYGGSFPSHGEVLSQLTGRHTFTDETTAGTTFSWPAPALSAAFYLVRVQAWPKDVKMTVSLADPGGEAELSVYRAKGDTWTLVTRLRAGEFDFPKPEELAANGESLLLAVANANGSGRYTSSTSLQIGVNKAVESILPLLQKTVRFKNQINAIFVRTGDPTPQPSLMGTFFMLSGLSWKGATFTGVADDSALVTSGEPPFQTTLTGTVSPDGLTITNAHFKRYRFMDVQRPDSTGRVFRYYSEETYEWDTSALPIVVPSRGFTATTSAFTYQAKGAAAGASFSGFVCTKLFYNGLASEFSASKVQTINCTVSFPAEERYFNEINFSR